MYFLKVIVFWYGLASVIIAFPYFLIFVGDGNFADIPPWMPKLGVGVILVATLAAAESMRRRAFEERLYSPMRTESTEEMSDPADGIELGQASHDENSNPKVNSHELD